MGKDVDRSIRHDEIAQFLRAKCTTVPYERITKKHGHLRNIGAVGEEVAKHNDDERAQDRRRKDRPKRDVFTRRPPFNRPCRLPVIQAERRDND